MPSACRGSARCGNVTWADLSASAACGTRLPAAGFTAGGCGRKRHPRRHPRRPFRLCIFRLLFQRRNDSQLDVRRRRQVRRRHHPDLVLERPELLDRLECRLGRRPGQRIRANRGPGPFFRVRTLQLLQQVLDLLDLQHRPADPQLHGHGIPVDDRALRRSLRRRPSCRRSPW